MFRQQPVLMFCALFLVLTGSACSVPFAAATATPVESTVDLQLLRTQVQQTVAAGLTETALAMPTSTVTLTPTETATPEPTATNTLVPTLPVYNTPTLSSGCAIVSYAPEAGTRFKIGTDFDGRWELKNTGDDDWEAGEVAVKYLSGTEFQTKKDAVYSKEDVEPKHTTEFVVDMVAPKEAGHYTAAWALMHDDEIICYLYLGINVYE
jgi:hypothetical protein